MAMLASGAAAAGPAITDKVAAKQVLGKHVLTLQWLGFGDFRTAGTAAVVAKDGHWHLSGRQEQKEGVLELDGEVVAVDRATFTFEGKVVTRVEGIFGGKECRREGRFAFIRKGSRRYWRMYPIDNPCDTAADYIDIYLR
jgi:hypothetical protein